MSQGRSSPQIAAELYIGKETVKTYRKRIMRKLGADNSAHAVAVAIRKGWIE